MKPQSRRNRLSTAFRYYATIRPALVKAHAEIVSALGRSGWVTRDPDDDKFIDAALTAGAAIIVSGDRHLLDLGTVEGVEVLTARQFLDRLPDLSEDGDNTTH